MHSSRLLILGACLCSLLFASGEAGSATGSEVGSAIAVDSIALTVSDMDRAVDFYSRVLTFEKVADREVAGEQYEHLFGVFGARIRSVRMRLGDEQIELMQFLTPHGRPVPEDSRSNDQWFQHVAIIVSDMDAAYTRLRSFHVEHASTSPQRLPDWNRNAAGIRAFYFKDPDHHNLEILQFPADKGLAKWHARDARLFLGIDHTAIVVSDTTASLRFYRDILGFNVVGESDNYGTEQEHLNNVFGAHLHITSLRAPQGGPGVEFLEYLAPRTGRPFPPNSQPNDLWYWQINLRDAPAADASPLPHPGPADLAATSWVNLTDPALGWRQALLAHDPDGHASLLGHPHSPRASLSSDPAFTTSSSARAHAH